MEDSLPPFLSILFILPIFGFGLISRNRCPHTEKIPYSEVLDEVRLLCLVNRCSPGCRDTRFPLLLSVRIGRTIFDNQCVTRFHELYLCIYVISVNFVKK